VGRRTTDRLQREMLRVEALRERMGLLLERRKLAPSPEPGVLGVRCGERMVGRWGVCCQESQLVPLNMGQQFLPSRPQSINPPIGTKADRSRSTQPPEYRPKQTKHVYKKKPKQILHDPHSLQVGSKPNSYFGICLPLMESIGKHEAKDRSCNHKRL